MNKIEEINPNAYYSASHLVRHGWVWMKSVLTFTIFLNTDEGRRIFKPLVIKRGAVTRYQIMGSAVIEALQSIEKGELKIDHE